MAIKAPLILSLNVGMPKRLGVEGSSDPDEQPWTSAIYKDPVEGPVRLTRTGLEGDGHAEEDGHGGTEMAVLIYAADHYAAWKQELGQPFLKHGAFGENFTVSRLTEETVCIGDSYVVGEARIQISMPRAPCWKLARRFKVPDMVERVRESGRTGWYLSVLQEGFVERSNFVVLEDRPYPEWTVARAWKVYLNRVAEPSPARELAACPALPEHWRRRLASATD